MDKNFEEVVDEVYEEELAVAEEEPKEGFFKRTGNAIKVKKDEFAEKHPKAAKVCSVVGKVAVGTGLVIGGIFIGNAVSKGDDYDEDYPGYDDEVTDSDVVEGNE